MAEYDTSLADVLKRTIYDAQDLVRGELALARAELSAEMRRLASGAGTLAAGAIAGILAAVFLLTAAAWGITAALAWPVWTGFAIVGGAMAVVAVVLAMSGRARLTRERHMRLTVETMKENTRWMQGHRS